MKAPKKALLEKINVEDINILVPTLVKMFKLKSSKDKILKTKDIVTFFNNKKSELGLKTSFNTQRLQKLINYIRVNSILPIITTSTGYYSSFDKQDILETIAQFDGRIEAMIAAREGMRYIITQEKTKEVKTIEVDALGFEWEVKKK